MSPRASRINPAQAVSVPWSSSIGMPLRGIPETTPEPAAHAQRQPPDPVEQESHLAALERDAFAKGYAQGERAGVEAGNRAAMRCCGVWARRSRSWPRFARRFCSSPSDSSCSSRSRWPAASCSARSPPTTSCSWRSRGWRSTGSAKQGRRRSGCIPKTSPALRRAARERWEAAHVTVVADAAVSRGGCLVESPFGFVDASIDAQFQELARALLDGETAGLEGTQPMSDGFSLGRYLDIVRRTDPLPALRTRHEDGRPGGRVERSARERRRALRCSTGTAGHRCRSKWSDSGTAPC